MKKLVFMLIGLFFSLLCSSYTLPECFVYLKGERIPVQSLVQLVDYDGSDIIKVHLVNHDGSDIVKVHLVDYAPDICGQVQIVSYNGKEVTRVHLVDYHGNDVLNVHLVDYNP